MGRTEVFAFVDWLTSRGEIEYATVSPNTEPNFFRNGRLVRAVDMANWVRTWLEAAGIPQTRNNVLWLVREAFQLVFNETVYPGRLNRRLNDYCRQLENNPRNTSIYHPSPVRFTPYSIEQVAQAFIQQNPQYDFESVIVRLSQRNPIGTILVCG